MDAILSNEKMQTMLAKKSVEKQLQDMRDALKTAPYYSQQTAMRPNSLPRETTKSRIEARKIVEDTLTPKYDATIGLLGLRTARGKKRTKRTKRNKYKKHTKKYTKKHSKKRKFNKKN